MTAHKGWRTAIEIHPACEALPKMSPEQLASLASSIKDGGNILQHGVILCREPDGAVRLLAGRHRLDALELNGVNVLTEDGKVDRRYVDKTIPAADIDAARFVIAEDIERRHLTQDQKREVLATLLKANPKQTNREAARTVGVDHKTVATVRTKLEAVGEIPQQETRTSKDGKTYRAKKAKKAKPGKRKAAGIGTREPIEDIEPGELPEALTEALDEVTEAEQNTDTIEALQQTHLRVADMAARLETYTGPMSQELVDAVKGVAELWSLIVVMVEAKLLIQAGEAKLVEMSKTEPQALDAPAATAVADAKPVTDRHDKSNGKTDLDGFLLANTDLSNRDAAKAMGVSSTTIHRRRHKLGLRAA